MQAAFARILNMSLTGSIVIAVVLLARLFLKRAPKIYSYALWAVVLFRLLCPLSITAGLSVLKPIPVTTTPGISTVSYQPVAQAVRNSASDVQREPVPLQTQEQGKQEVSILLLAAVIWLTGASVMAIYSVAQYLLLGRKLAEAVPLQKEVYLADRISSPFVMGVLRPRIYLPSSTPVAERQFILAHERHHIRRGDPIWKLLGYAALCLHWFNPLVWLAFCLGGKDMEMSCDEAVIQQLGAHIRADYSRALLRLATHKRMVSGMPLAFGEGDTKGRVLNMARWKKPKIWVSALCVVICLIIAAACALNPRQEEQPDSVSVPYQIGELPTGFTWEATTQGSIDLWKGNTVVGGITGYRIPDGVYDPYDDAFLWLEDVGIPDLNNPELSVAGMFSWSGSNGCSLTVQNDFQNPTVQRSHRFQVAGNMVYDFWLNDILLDTQIQFALTDAIRFVEPDVPSQEQEITQEDEAFLRAQSVMKGLGDSAMLIQTECRYPNAPQKNYIKTFHYDHELGFLRLTTTADGADHAALYVNDHYYTNQGSETSGELQWVETEPPQEFRGPWLGGFDFIRHYVTYQDTTREAGATVDMFRIDALFEDTPQAAPFYFASFRYDGDGSFVDVTLQINPGRDDAYTLTESIVTTNQQTIDEALERESARAAQ